jgi:hypothetical protein
MSSSQAAADAPSDVATGGHRISSRHLELVSAALLALATVATAWSGYQASTWHGEQAREQASATAKRLDATRASGVANRQVQIDVALFMQWVNARARGDAKLAEFYRRRFRPRFEPAFAAWLASKPLQSPNAAPTPFDLPVYRVPASVAADRLETAAGVSAAQARRAIDRANDYVLAVVLLATALFFAGMSAKFPTPRVQLGLLVISATVFVGTIAWLATFPVE